MITIRPRRYLFWVLSSASLFLMLSAAASAADPPIATVNVKSITLGLVSATSQKDIEAHFQSFVGYVARKLASGLNAQGKVVIAPTPLQMAKLLEESKIDFYMESPYPTYLINKQGAAVLMLRRWKSGIAEYRSLIFSKKDGDISRLEQLRGKMIAFEDPGSTSGYFLPKVLLLKKGLTLTEKPGPSTTVGRKEIGYIFASANANVVNLVLAKRVAAGAFSDDDYGTLDGSQKADVAILAQSEPFPRHLLSVRKDLDPAVKKRLREILLSMHLDEDGRMILQQTDQTTKFDILPGGEEMMRRKLVDTFRPR